MSEKLLPGGVRLAEMVDLTPGSQLWRTDWQRIPGLPGARSRFNPRGFSIVWVVMRVFNKQTGVVQDSYIQPKIVEDPGVIVVLRYRDKYGLIEEYRAVGPRLPLEVIPGDKRGYVARLVDEGKFPELMENLGEMMLQAARGIVPEEGVQNVTDENIRLAQVKSEVLQEAGCKLGDVQPLGPINWNPTFSPHAQYCYEAHVIEVGTAAPEERESIGALKFYSVDELRELVRTRRLEDGMTLAALSLAGVSLRG